MTRENYVKRVRHAVGDASWFMDLARRDRRKAEDFLIGFVASKRGKVARTTPFYEIGGDGSVLNT